VEYRKDFEKSKGTVMSVADDPSMQHARQAGMNASAFNYSGGAKERPTNNNVDDYTGVS